MCAALALSPRPTSVPQLYQTLRRGWFANPLDYRTLLHFSNLLRLCDSLLMKRNQGHLRGEHFIARANLMTMRETAKRSKKSEVDRQTEAHKHVNFSRNPDTQKCKTTTTNNRIHQYLLVCPAAYEVFFVYYSMYFLEQLSEIGGIIPVLLLRTVKLNEVNNMHRVMPVVHGGFAVPALVCDWPMLPWERQLAHFLLSGKVGVGIYILSVKLSQVCTVLLGSTKEVPGFFPHQILSPWGY